MSGVLINPWLLPFAVPGFGCMLLWKLLSRTGYYLSIADAIQTNSSTRNKTRALEDIFNPKIKKIVFFWERFKDIFSLKITEVNIFLGFNSGLVFIYEIHCFVGTIISKK